jgi:hypothetical protein
MITSVKIKTREGRYKIRKKYIFEMLIEMKDDTMLMLMMKIRKREKK